MPETQNNPVGSHACDHHRTEEAMLREDTVQEVLARLARGEQIKAIAREIGADRKTSSGGDDRATGSHGQGRPRPQGLDPYRDRLVHRGPEGGWNAVVVHRELQGLGFTGGVQQVRHAIRPWRAEARRTAMATVRYETSPGHRSRSEVAQSQSALAHAVSGQTVLH